MNIHSICIVKDEADIIGDVITAASKWSDYIYIYDNGSTDGTTEILKKLSQNIEGVNYYKWSDRRFHNTLRQQIYQAYKHNSCKGDWWCRLDADEIYIDDPKTFIQNIKGRANTIIKTSYNYYFTDKDLAIYQKDPDSFSYKKLKYYKNNFGEVRFVRDSGHLYWPPSSSWPVMNMRVYDKRIRVKHYQYRNPAQIKKRKINRELAYPNFDPYKRRNIGNLNNSAILNAEERLVDHKALVCENGGGHLVAGESIQEWRPDDSLTSRIKITVKNALYRVKLLKVVYKALGRNQ